MTTETRTALQVAQALNDAQRAALRSCVAQDPDGRRTSKRGGPDGKGRRMAVDCDGRIAPSLITLRLLGRAEGFDALYVVTPFGREVAALLTDKALTPAQQRILAEVREHGERVYNGRARKSVKALENAGLVTVQWDIRASYGRGGMDYSDRITVRPRAN